MSGMATIQICLGHVLCHLKFYHSDKASLQTNVGIQCQFCPEAFVQSDKRIYYKHANDFHSEELADWHKCSTCNLNYPTNISLAKHAWFAIFLFYWPLARQGKAKQSIMTSPLHHYQILAPNHQFFWHKIFAIQFLRFNFEQAIFIIQF